MDGVDANLITLLMHTWMMIMYKPTSLKNSRHTGMIVDMEQDTALLICKYFVR
jgi:hypothetical protein